MRKFMRKLWRDDRGCVLALEWAFVASILTLGAIAGLLAVRPADEAAVTDWPAALTR